jgi:YgiT-type zinc finger domain-containing protein
MFHCHICGSNEAHEETIDEVFNLNGKHVLVEGIPAKICTHCGDKTFSRKTTERIRKIIHSPIEPVKSVSMDVFEYA